MKYHEEKFKNNKNSKKNCCKNLTTSDKFLLNLSTFAQPLNDDNDLPSGISYQNGAKTPDVQNLIDSRMYNAAESDAGN